MATRPTAKDKRVFGETLKSARLGAPDAQYEVGLMYANGIGVEQDIGQAVHWVSQAAKRGMAAAQYLLATRYEAGIGVAQSAHLAMLWFSKAADQGHAKAQLRLGVLYGRSHPEQAVQFLRAAADSGLPAAQYALANAYRRGDGLDPDLLQALVWYEAAARQGLAQAQFALGEIKLLGLVDGPDLSGALGWLRKAAKQDYLAAQVAIEKMERDGAPGAGLRGVGSRKAGVQERRRKEDRWIRAAEGGGADARYHLGLMYEHGLGVDADNASARYWYGVSAQQGHAQAQLALARLSEALGAPDAYKWYRSAADAGEIEAQFALGRMHSKGAGAPDDPLLALELWAQAAQRGHVQALVALGHWMDSGTRKVSTACYRKAALLGDAEAQYALAQQLDKESGLAGSHFSPFEWYEKAAHQGHPGAQYVLGVAYLKGQSVGKNFKQALKWLLLAAEQGDARAQWNLGKLYTNGGDGLKRDLKLAFQWFQRAADQGFTAATSNLGILYALTGLPERAVAAWELAAEKDDPEALYNLALAYIKGEGVKKDESRAVSLLCRAAELGVIAAQSRLGLMYATGDGVVLDPIESVKWLTLAATGHDQAALANLERVSTLSSLRHILEGQRRAIEWKKYSLLGAER